MRIFLYKIGKCILIRIRSSQKRARILTIEPVTYTNVYQSSSDFYYHIIITIFKLTIYDSKNYIKKMVFNTYSRGSLVPLIIELGRL